MAKEIKTILARAPDSLVADAVGAVALMALLLVGLHLPGVF